MKTKALNFPIIALLSLCFISIFSGCDDDKEKGKTPQGIRRTFKGAGGTVTIETNHKEISIANPLNISISASCKENWQISFPEFKDKMEKFSIRSLKEMPATLSDDGKNKTEQVIAVLDPYLAGKYTIPAMKIDFTNPQGKSYKTHTDAITINVTSVIPPDDKKPNLRDITAVTELLFKIKLWMIIATIAAIVAIIAIVVFIIKKTAKKPEEENVLQPHEIALNELDTLLHSALLKNGQIKVFYLKMSNILRHYIEQRFEIAAPERTTEEFMEELKNDPALNTDHKILLKRFLRHCDLVKFARHQPSKTDIDSSISSCRSFIEETIPAPQPIEINEQIAQG